MESISVSRTKVFDSEYMSPIQQRLDGSMGLASVNSLQSVFKDHYLVASEHSRLFEDRIAELIAVNRSLQNQTNSHDRKVKGLHDEITRLQRKIEKYRAVRAKRDEEQLEDLHSLEIMTSLAAAKDKELQARTQEFKTTEALYLEKLKATELTGTNNIERINYLTDRLHQLQQEVGANIIDRAEFLSLESNYKNNTVPLQKYEETLQDLQFLRKEISNKYVSSNSYELLRSEVKNLTTEKKLLEESLYTLLEQKQNTAASLEAAEAKILALESTAVDAEAELEELRRSIGTYRSEASSSKQMINSILNIVDSKKVEPAVKNTFSNEPPCSEQNANIFLTTQLSSAKLQLRQERKFLSAVNLEVVGLKNALEAAKQLEQELRTAFDQMKAELTEENLHLKSEIFDKDKELVDWKANGLELESKIFELEKSIKVIRKERTIIKRAAKQV